MMSSSLARKVFQLQGQGKTEHEIMSKCNITAEKVWEILG